KELNINKLTPFTSDRRKVKMFLQECRIYLTVNDKLYFEDGPKIAFILSFMNGGEAAQWKESWIDSITQDDRTISLPTLAEFYLTITEQFKEVNRTQDADMIDPINAIHKLTLLRQGKKSAEQLVTEFTLL
ncbi:hypothetical protein BYT27DRAFT_7048166, partial [Phlegmacium glaucopus]